MKRMDCRVKPGNDELMLARMGTSPRMTEENFQAVRAFRNECLDRQGTILLVALFLSLKRPSLMGTCKFIFN
jgi:hypothetical protein